MKTSLSLLGLLLAVDGAAAEPTALDRRVEALGRVGYATGAQISPDGKTVAYITALSGSPQLWTIGIEGGYPRQVTAHSDPVSGISWAPDGKALAYSVAPGGGYAAQIHLVTPSGQWLRRLTAGGDENNFAGEFVADGRYHFRSNRRDPAKIDGWIWDPKSGNAELAVEIEGLGSISDLAGSKALVTRFVTRGNANLWLDDLEAKTSVLLTPHEGPALVEGRFAEDGRSVYVSHNLELDDTVFARIDVDEDGTVHPPRTLAARPGAQLDGFELRDDRRTALLFWNVGGKTELELISLPEGVRRPITGMPAELAGGADFTPDGSAVVLTVSGSTTPVDLWRLDLADSTWTRLTFSPHPGVDLTELVAPALRSFRAHDGLELSGWLYQPPGFVAPGPVVLSFHGGPEGQERPTFRPDYQALLGAGIAVFAPNIRGSAGFGKAFLALDNHEKRFDANRDIESAAKFIVEAGIGAPGRLGIVGGSYGGYAVMVGVTEFPDTFAAGANLFGIVNFETFFSHSTPWMGAISVGEYGDPATQRELLRALSPIHKLDRVKAAMLVLHGANDTNVPLIEAEQVISTLEQRGLDVGSVIFPDEGHGWRKTENRIRSAVEIVKFFVRTIGEGG
jgi:dipeptidyl aminopeptidase/acylaminoacyl peptidase